MELEAAGQRYGGIVNYFQGATIHNITINSGILTKNGDETHHYYGAERKDNSGYSDEQIAQALTNIVGTGRPIDSKQKWAGAMWLLRWRCNFPARAQEFCQRINSLPFERELEFKCEYNNIRLLSTLSFMNEDARHIENVKYSKNDEQVFFQMREIALELDKELEKTKESRWVV